MKIAQIPPLYESVPPRLYGGTERVVAHLCNALMEAGHDVSLFGCADARTKARLIPVRDQAVRLDATALKSDLASHLSMLHEVKRRAAQFDILHFHIDMLHFPMFELHAANSVTTLHGRLDLKDLKPVYAHWRQFGLVSISESQRAPLADANWLATVQHGVEQSFYRFNARAELPRGGYLAFLGRMSPEKNPEAAIRLAIASGMQLKIAAKVDSVDQAFFESRIAPLLAHPLIDFVGEIGDDQKSDFLGHAAALLFPIAWPEPFGLVMIEAMACGTPVIATRCGAVPEVIDDGLSGFIVDNEAQALEAIGRIHELDRYAVRRTYERRFTSAAMAQSYIDLYRRLQESRRLGRAS